MKHERLCVICGTKYSYCPNCAAYDHLPRWMFSFHDENCKKIWEVINDYKAGVKTANQAKAELQKLDISKKDEFDEGFQKHINTIFAEANSYTAEKREVKKNNNSESKFNYHKK